MLKFLRSTRRGLAAAAAVAAVTAGTALPAGPAAAAPQATGGSVFTWGSNGSGQLGDGTTTARADPEPVAALSPGTRQVAFNPEGFVAALNADGTVSAWGRNDSGQLGNNTTTDSLSPVNVKGLTGVTQISAGTGHMLALRSDGTVWAWGGNGNGQLGDGTTTDRSVPGQVPGLTGVMQVVAGDSSYALRSDGTVWAWGSNNAGQLGDGTQTRSLVPQQVVKLAGMQVTHIAAGGDSAFAVISDGTLDGWGGNQEGALGDGTTIDRLAPVRVPSLSGVTQVSTSGVDTLAVAGDSGQLWAWGDNRFGELGDGTATQQLLPEQIALSGITQVSAGLESSTAIRPDGTLLSWGANAAGQLGYASPSGDQLVPRVATALAGVSQAQISFGTAVVIGRFPPVQVPDLTDLDRTTASAQLQAAQLVLGPVRTLVDPTCTEINKVVSQDPGPGSMVSRGTAIAIWLGARPKSGCHGG